MVAPRGERQLQAGQLHQAQLGHAGGDDVVVAAGGPRPGQHVAQALDARERARERKQPRLPRRVQQVQEAQLAVVRRRRRAAVRRDGVDERGDGVEGAPGGGEGFHRVRAGVAVAARGVERRAEARPDVEGQGPPRARRLPAVPGVVALVPVARPVVVLRVAEPREAPLALALGLGLGVCAARVHVLGLDAALRAQILVGPREFEVVGPLAVVDADDLAGQPLVGLVRGGRGAPPLDVRAFAERELLDLARLLRGRLVPALPRLGGLRGDAEDAEIGDEGRERVDGRAPPLRRGL